jgi:hypothetical protein
MIFEKLGNLLLPIAITIIAVGLLYMVMQTRIKQLETKLDTLCNVVNDEVAQRQQMLQNIQQVGGGGSGDMNGASQVSQRGVISMDGDNVDIDNIPENIHMTFEDNEANKIYVSDEEEESDEDESDEEDESGDEDEDEGEDAQEDDEELDIPELEMEITDIQEEKSIDIGIETQEVIELSPTEEPEPETTKVPIEEFDDDKTEYNEPDQHNVETMTALEIRKLPVAFLREYVVSKEIMAPELAKSMKKRDIVTEILSFKQQ